MSAIEVAAPLTGERQTSGWRSVAPALVGNVLEWYDFTVYAFVASHIARGFFPSSDPVSALLAAFAAFGIGFLARPLGGIVIGRFGDLRGRKAALLLTIYLMAGATFVIAVLPTYQTIGLLAPVLLVLARLAQGFSAGGEFGGAVSFMVEWAPDGRRGLYGSYHALGIAIGILLGSAVAAFLSSVLVADDMLAWGWRLPFLIGSVLGPIGLYMRRRIAETPSYREVATERAAPVPMLRDGEGFRRAVKACGMSVLSNASYYVLLFYMPTWLQTYAKLEASSALWVNTIGLVALAGFVPMFGLVSDLIGRKPVLLTSCLAIAILPYLCFEYLLAHQPAPLPAILLTQCLFSLIIAMLGGALPTALVEVFATKNRSTWVGVGYSTSATIFGGFAPFMSVWLINALGTPIAPSYYLLLCAIVSGIATLFARETAFERLR